MWDSQLGIFRNHFAIELIEYIECSNIQLIILAEFRVRAARMSRMLLLVFSFNARESVVAVWVCVSFAFAYATRK